MQQVIDSLTSKSVRDMIDTIAPTFKSAPHLPKGFVEFLANIAPWLTGLGGVLGVLSGLSLISSGMGWQASVLSQFAVVSPAYFLVIGILQLVAAVIMLLAFKPLKDRKVEGWILMFWNMAISVVQSIVAVVFGLGIGSVIGAAIGLAIGLYVMFEMRGEYS
jgi:hypothetical protein